MVVVMEDNDEIEDGVVAAKKLVVSDILIS